MEIKCTVFKKSLLNVPYIQKKKSVKGQMYGMLKRVYRVVQSPSYIPIIKKLRKYLSEDIYFSPFKIFIPKLTCTEKILVPKGGRDSIQEVI